MQISHETNCTPEGMGLILLKNAVLLNARERLVYSEVTIGWLVA